MGNKRESTRWLHSTVCVCGGCASSRRAYLKRVRDARRLDIDIDTDTAVFK